MRPKTHVYKKTDGCELRADVYPAAESAGPVPVVAYFHGGCLIMGWREWVNERLVADSNGAGYAVVSFDHRLAPETKLPGIIEDVRDALKWVREEGPLLFNADTERIAVAGASAGGYLTLMTGLFEPRPRALVSFYGYGDLVGDWYSKPDPFYCREPAVTEEAARAAVGETPLSEGERTRGTFYVYCRQKGIWPNEISGHGPGKEPEFFRPYCPAENVTADYPPTILLHGDADTDVPYGLSVMMAAALEKAGVEHEFITIPGGPHCFDRDVTGPVVEDAFKRVRAFLSRHLE
ncbi:MAG: alpha/beta hydrolase [Planctomycetota bacterium]|jgi:acetyl esterase/lipase